MIHIFVGEKSNAADMHLCPGQNLYTGITHFREEFGEVNSLEEDLLNLAAGIYGADLCVIRDQREHFVRNIKLSIEVVNNHALELVRVDLEKALHIVSKDNWQIKFISKKGNGDSSFDWTPKEGAVLLFSGGIDSMCAASEFLKGGYNLVLVSHNSPGNAVVDACQKSVHSALKTFYKQEVKHIQFRVFGRNHGGFNFLSDDGRENTQRTRSFLFLTLAALVTRRVGFDKILYMAENGQFAIHLPLNQARVGPFSTHTADPEFVSAVERVFRTVLRNDAFTIVNPFGYKTKAEVFSLLPPELQKEARHSASCWMISRTENGKHCGYCIPCISRRIAIEYNGLKFDEYETDVFKTDVSKLPDAKDQKRNLVDYLEFILKFEKVTKSNRLDVLAAFPELYNPSLDTDKALSLYKRVAEQSMEVFKKYPKVIKLIG